MMDRFGIQKMGRSMLCVAALFLLGLGVASVAEASPTKGYYQYPTVHKNTVVFSAEGDLWRVSLKGGQAQRLTNHPGPEAMARFSPDGKWLAFSAYYGGDMDVYVIPAQGGMPKRLTFRAGPEYVVGWAPNSDYVVFRSLRSSPSRHWRLFYVPVNGKTMPRRARVGYGSSLTFGPKEAQVAFTRYARETRNWKRYLGGWAQDIWVGSLLTRKYTKITKYPGTDAFPMWAGKRIYFVSDRTGKRNLFSINPKTRKIWQHTFHKNWDVRWPSLGGNHIVYQLGADIWTLNLTTQKSRKVDISLATDSVQRQPRTIAAGRYVGSYDLGPKGKRMLLNVRGELFNIPVKEGVQIRVTRSSGIRQKYASFTPDGKHIIAMSDRSGEDEIVKFDALGEKPPKAITKGGKAWRFWPVMSPNKKWIAFGDKNLKLWVACAKSGKLQLVTQNKVWEIKSYTWSPDSRYLAYVKPERNQFRSIMIYDTKTKKNIRATRTWTDDFNPAWGPKGKRLYFLSRREIKPFIGSFDFTDTVDESTKVYSIVLASKTKAPFAPKDALLQQRNKEDKKAAKKCKKGTHWCKKSKKCKADKKKCGKGQHWCKKSKKCKADKKTKKTKAAKKDKAAKKTTKAKKAKKTAKAKVGKKAVKAKVGKKAAKVKVAKKAVKAKAGKKAAKAKSAKVAKPAAEKKCGKGTHWCKKSKKCKPNKKKCGEGSSWCKKSKKCKAKKSCSSSCGKKKACSKGKKKACSKGKKKCKKGFHWCKKSKKCKRKKKKMKVRIDVKGLLDRVYEMPGVPAGHYFGLSAVNGRLFWMSRPTMKMSSRRNYGWRRHIKMHVYLLKAKKLKTLARGVYGYSLSANLKFMALRVRAGFRVMPTRAMRMPRGRKGLVSVRGLRMEIEPVKEWKQILLEAWRLQRDFYWAPNLAGIQWAKVRDRYLTLLPRLLTRSELNDVIGEMIAELGTSHTYVWGGDRRRFKYAANGVLGADLEADTKAGLFRIKKIYRGAPWSQESASPLAAHHLKLAKGTYILAIDGRRLTTKTNYFRYLQNKARKLISLTVNSKPTLKGARRVVVKAMGWYAARGLRYVDWVESRRKLTLKLSGGKVGYMHLPNMSGAGLIAFYKMWYPQIRKRAMVIDVRGNGGGFVSQMIIQKLMRKIWAFFKARNSQYNETVPDRTFHGHVAVVTNATAGSDGDIFCKSFQLNKLGLVFGTRTWGGVVGIRADKRFMDGGATTQPEFAWWSPSIGWSLENSGVTPDVVVDNTPTDVERGNDRQLKAAVKHLLKQLKKDPKFLPKLPAYPNKSVKSFRKRMKKWQAPPAPRPKK